MSSVDYFTLQKILLLRFAFFSVHFLILKVEFMCSASYIVGEVSKKVSVVRASLFIINTSPDCP